MAENSSGSRNAVWGSSRPSIPWIDAYTILSGAIGSGDQSERGVRVLAYSSRLGASPSGAACSFPAKTPPARVAPAMSASAKRKRDLGRFKKTPLENAHSGTPLPESLAGGPGRVVKSIFRGEKHVWVHRNARIDSDFR